MTSLSCRAHVSPPKSSVVPRSYALSTGHRWFNYEIVLVCAFTRCDQRESLIASHWFTINYQMHDILSMPWSGDLPCILSGRSNVIDEQSTMRELLRTSPAPQNYLKVSLRVVHGEWVGVWTVEQATRCFQFVIAVTLSSQQTSKGSKHFSHSYWQILNFNNMWHIFVLYMVFV